MKVVIKVLTGPHLGRQIEFQSGQIVRVGRSAQADASFRNDRFMSGIHCILQCGVKVCSIKDNDSANGLLVNGNKVRSGELRNGDEILIGSTRFAVHFQDVDAPSQSQPLSKLWIEFQPLYAILDAAREPKIVELLKHAGAEHQSLYEGARGAEMSSVAPYLVRLPEASPLLKTLEDEGRQQSWGVFLTCEQPLKEVRKHLRRLLTVKLPSGSKVLFRYYDPRVLRVFLPTTDKEQAVEFFGPVKSFITEDENAGSFLEFTIKGGEVLKRELAV
jgi:hypothetical protein